MKQIIVVYLSKSARPLPSVKQVESLKIVSVEYKPPG